MKNRLRKIKNNRKWLSEIRESRQFGEMSRRWNFASVSRKIRKEFYKKQIEKILSSDLDLYDKYIKLKNQKWLTPSDLSFVFSMEISPEQKEIMEYYNKLSTKRLYDMYLEIKDRPWLTSHDLLFVFSMRKWFEKEKILKHYEIIKLEEEWK